MPQEQFANGAPSNTVSTSYASGATSIVMNSISGYPLVPQFRLLNIRTGEVVVVVGIAGVTLTVLRGAESTTAAAINSGDNLNHILTAGALGNLGNTLRIVPTPPSLCVDYASSFTATLPPASYANITAQAIETRATMPQWGSTTSPPWSPYQWGYANYPVLTNFSCQIRARFVCPSALGGAWNFSWSSDDSTDISVWTDAAFTTQVGSTIGTFSNSTTNSGNGNVTLTGGSTYYLRVRWAQGAGGYSLWVQYTPPGGVAHYLMDDMLIGSTLYVCPFRAIGCIGVVGDTRNGDRLDLLSSGGAVQSSFRVNAAGQDASLPLLATPYNGTVRLSEADGTVVGTLAQTFNGGEFIRVGSRQ
jgi:hypothetical protein